MENVNGTVDEWLSTSALQLVLAQVEIEFSNSMIEAFWRSLCHGWLYLNTLDTIATLRKLVEFYIEQHNTVMPHSAFNGQTPDEVYCGSAADLPVKLAEQRASARIKRLEANRK
ncbi:MAG: integrase core domain-containing protein, partial [Pseudomonadota bacterium]